MQRRRCRPLSASYVPAPGAPPVRYAGWSSVAVSGVHPDRGWHERWLPHSRWPSTPSSRWTGGSQTKARSPSSARPCRSRSAQCAAGCARRPSPSEHDDACLTVTRCRAIGPSPACRGRSSSRRGSARWFPESGCRADNACRTAPSRHRDPAGSVQRPDRGLLRRRSANRAVARKATPPTRSRRSGRCSRSRRGTRSRRSTERGSASCATRTGPEWFRRTARRSRCRRRASCPGLPSRHH